MKEHYEKMGIDVYDFALANDLNMLEANIVKYVCRKKGDVNKRLQDFDKAVDTINRLREYVLRNEQEQA